MQRSSENRRSLPAKKSKASSDGHTKNQYTCTRCGRKHGPGKCPAYGKECKRKGHFAEQCVARKTLVLTARDLAKGNKKPDPRRSFTKQLQTQKVAKQTSQEYDTDEVTVQVYSVEAKAEETKSTHFAKKLPKHVTKVCLDEDQSPDVLYATVELGLPSGSTRKLKGKVDTGARVNLMNYMTFREIFGDDAGKTCTTVK